MLVPAHTAAFREKRLHALSMPPRPVFFLALHCYDSYTDDPTTGVLRRWVKPRNGGKRKERKGKVRPALVHDCGPLSFPGAVARVGGGGTNEYIAPITARCRTGNILITSGTSLGDGNFKIFFIKKTKTMAIGFLWNSYSG